MDLDNIKQTWSQLDQSPPIEECKIRLILNNKGKDALSRLMKYERIFLWLLIPCAAIGFFFYCIHHFTGIFYSVLLLVAFFWQAYKIQYLKNTDLSLMRVLDVSKRINIYKKYIYSEIVVGCFFAIIFFVSYIFYALPSLFPDREDGAINLFMLFTFSLLLFATIIYVLYRKIYIKNIRALKKSIAEVKDFEKDNA